MTKSPKGGKHPPPQPRLTYGKHGGSTRCSGTATLPDGTRRRIQATAPTEDQARQCWEQRYRDLCELVYYGERKRAGEITLGEAIRDLLESYTAAPRDGPRGERLLRDSTLQRMRCAYQQLIVPEPIAGIRVKDLTAADVTRWRAAVNARISQRTGRPLSATSKMRALTLIQDVTRTYRPGDDPCIAAGKWHQTATRKQAPNSLTSAETVLLIEHCKTIRAGPQDGLGPVYAALTVLLLLCYMRPGEAYGLQARDWNPAEGRLDIHRTGVYEDGRLKTDASFREIYPPAEAAELLGDLCKGLEPRDRLFRSPRAATVDPHNYSRWLQRQLRLLGISKPSFSPHKLRGSGISYALALGVPPEIVQANAGHASITTTMGWYATVHDDRRRAAATLYKGG